MPRYGRRSRRNLNTCDKSLQGLFNEVIKHFDCSVLGGFRDRDGQDTAYASGHSTKKWPDSKHNSKPSIAVDVAPYPIDWKDIERFIYFGGVVKGFAFESGLPLRWGGDWNNDTQLSDNIFDDLVHFEVKKE